VSLKKIRSSCLFERHSTPAQFSQISLTAGLGQWVSIPCTYAGGAKDISDLALVDTLSNGKVDLTFGSALDIFGGSGVKFDELVEADRQAKEASAAAGSA